jgi:hypothetical protein
LESALRVLIRFHETHPDWFPPVSGGVNSPRPVALDPEWETAIEQAYASVKTAGQTPKIEPV